MIDLAADFGIDRVKAYHLFAFSKELNNESMMNLKEEYNKIYKNTIKRANKHEIDVFLAAPFELNNNKIINKNIKKVPCPLLWHEFWISKNFTFIDVFMENLDDLKANKLLIKKLLNLNN